MSLDYAFERAPALQAILASSGQVLQANARFRQSFGPECVGSAVGGLLRVVSPGLASFVRRLLLKQAEFRVDDLLLRTRYDGELRVEAHGVVLVPEDQFLLALVDQTERVTAATARAQRERSQTIARFAGGLSHDLNNMLSAIVSTAQAGAQDALEQAGDPEKDFRAIIDSAARGAALARSLRSIAFDETGSWRPVELGEEVRAIAAVLGRGSSGVPIALALEDGIPEVIGDRARLHQLVLNLMVNARDATRERGGGIEVELKATAAGGVRFSVADAGPGVPIELRSQIFEPYFTTKDQEEGSSPDSWGRGLGLAIVDAVVHATGATIEVGESRNGGALFVIEWPVTSVMRVAPASVGAEPSRVQPLEVLLADEEVTLVGAVARQLRRVGHSVYAAVSAEECRALFGQFAHRIEVAVVDAALGGSGGETLAQELRHARPDLGIVLLTAGRRRGLQGLEPPVRVLEKPFDFKDLARAIHAASGRS